MASAPALEDVTGELRGIADQIRAAHLTALPGSDFWRLVADGFNQAAEDADNADTTRWTMGQWARFNHAVRTARAWEAHPQ